MKVKGIRPIAEFFEVNERSIRNWRAQGAPISKKYEADLAEVQLWRAKYKRGGGGGRQAVLTPQSGQDYEKARLTRLQADKMEIELAEKRGEVMPVIESQKRYMVHATILRTGLMNFSHYLPPLLARKDEREISAILLKRIRDLLWSFAGKLFKAEVAFRIRPTKDEFVQTMIEFYEQEEEFHHDDAGRKEAFDSSDG